MMQQPPPYPPYPQQPPPGYFGPFVPPPKKPVNVRKVMRIIIFIVCLPALILVIAVAVDLHRDKKRDLVAFDNRLETTAEVFVDGKSLKQIGPHQHYSAVVTVPTGAKHIEVRSGGAVVSGVDIDFHPKATHGEEVDERGVRALYVIGAPREYVIAKVPYFEKMPTPPVYASRERIGKPSPLIALPQDFQSFELNVDGVFLESENVPGGTSVYWKRQLCSVGDDGTLGCHGYPTR